MVRGLKKPLWPYNPHFSQTRGSVDYISFPIPRKRFFLKATSGTPLGNRTETLAQILRVSS
jgi:hypothetical protein